MDKLDAFLRLSHYLKSYELYKDFSRVDTKHKGAIESLRNNLENKEYLTKEDKDALDKYYKLFEKIDMNNKLLESSFNNYDFSDINVSQSIIDYKLYAYEFIFDTIVSSMEKKEFSQKNDVINHINAAIQVLERYFIEKFFIPSDFSIILEKAFEKVLSLVITKQFKFRIEVGEKAKS